MMDRTQAGFAETKSEGQMLLYYYIVIMMMALIVMIVMVCVMLIITIMEALGIEIVMILMKTGMMMMITLTAHSVVSREENMWGILGLIPACPSLSVSFK